MSPEHIRQAGIFGFAIFIGYWFLLWLLKPETTGLAQDYTSQATATGPGSVAVGGANYGSIETNVKVEPAQIVLTESQKDWVETRIRESGLLGSRVDVIGKGQCAAAAIELAEFLLSRGVPEVRRSNAEVTMTGGAQNGPIMIMTSNAFGPASANPPPRIFVLLK